MINPLTHLSDYLGILLSINIALVVFNLVPAFPMDGGRILRALLTLGLKNHQKATTIASYIGQVIAIIFVIGGAYFDHLMLLFIGLFVFLTARAERRSVSREALLTKTVAHDIMRMHDYTYSVTQDPMTLKSSHTYLAYDSKGILLGVISNKRDFRNGDLLNNPTEYISQQYGYVNSQVPLTTLFDIMKSQYWELVIVLDNDRKELGVIDRPLLLNYINNKL